MEIRVHHLPVRTVLQLTDMARFVIGHPEFHPAAMFTW